MWRLKGLSSKTCRSKLFLCIQCCTFQCTESESLIPDFSMMTNITVSSAVPPSAHLGWMIHSIYSLVPTEVTLRRTQKKVMKNSLKAPVAQLSQCRKVGGWAGGSGHREDVNLSLAQILVQENNFEVVFAGIFASHQASYFQVRK